MMAFALAQSSVFALSRTSNPRTRKPSKLPSGQRMSRRSQKNLTSWVGCSVKGHPSSALKESTHMSKEGSAPLTRVRAQYTFRCGPSNPTTDPSGSHFPMFTSKQGVLQPMVVALEGQIQGHEASIVPLTPRQICVPPQHAVEGLHDVGAG